MAGDERERLHRKLEEVLGLEEARTLMGELGSRGVTRRELRDELRGLESRLVGIDSRLAGTDSRMDGFESKLELLEARTDTKLANLESRMLERMNDQTRTLVRMFYVSNASMVLAVATLAFGAARLA